MKKLAPILIGMFVLLLLAMTNPTKTDYTTWLKEQYISQSTNDLNKSVFALFGGGLIDGSTKAKNFVIFSVYTTNIDATNRVTMLGLLHNYIRID